MNIISDKSLKGERGLFKAYLMSEINIELQERTKYVKESIRKS